MKKLTDKNFIKELWACQDRKVELWSYLIQSDFYKALRRHIIYDSPCVFFEHPQNYHITLQSNNIELLDFGVTGTYSSDEAEKDHEDLWLKLEITYELNALARGDFARKEIAHEIEVPINLFNKFSKAAFEQWLEGRKQAATQDQRLRSLEQLREIIKHDPGVVSEIAGLLESLQTN